MMVVFMVVIIAVSVISSVFVHGIMVENGNLLRAILRELQAIRSQMQSRQRRGR